MTNRDGILILESAGHQPVTLEHRLSVSACGAALR